MVNCAVASCKNTSVKATKLKDGITFHRFPKDRDRRKRWEVAVNREKEWVSSSSSAVCSEHFDSNDFYLTSAGLRRLSHDAIPAINISICEQPQHTLSMSEIDNIIDEPSSDCDQVMKLTQELRRVKILAENRRRKMKVMWQKQKRMKAKINRLKCVIHHLVQNKNRGLT